MVPVSISNSFGSLYSSAYSNLLRAFKGEEYNQERLNLQRIYEATDELFDAIRASLYSKTVNPEREIERVYYNEIVFHLLRFRQICKEHEKHSEANLFLVAIRCFESLQGLASRTKSLAEEEGIELKPYKKIDLQKDYPLGGTYEGEVSMVKTHKSSVHQHKEIRNKIGIKAKFYALYHWILIEMGVENYFKRDENDKYKRTEIEAFAQERYPGTSKQGFYRAFIEIDITKKVEIAKTFGPGYKRKIEKISNNSAKVIHHLKNYPN